MVTCQHTHRDYFLLLVLTDVTITYVTYLRSISILIVQRLPWFHCKMVLMGIYIYIYESLFLVGGSVLGARTFDGWD